MAEQAKDFSRGKISKPLAQEIIKYINDPIARSDFPVPPMPTSTALMS